MKRTIKKCPWLKQETRSRQTRRRNDFAQWPLAGFLAVSIIAHLVPSIAIAATIQGIAFIDFNDNGVMENCESPQANTPVFIMDNTLLDAGLGGFFTAMTDANGRYQSTTHNASSFSIWSDIPFGLKQSLPEMAEGAVTHDFTISGRNDTVTIDFGFFNPAIDQSQNQPPTLTVPNSTMTVDMDSPVSFSATVADPEGDSLCTVNWEFDDGSTADSLESKHTYTEPGTYTATLNVMDARGATGKASVDVTVKNVLPTVNLTAHSDTISICGDAARFTGEVTDTASDELTHLLDFGDGNTVKAASANHTYESQGSYTATLTSTDRFTGVSQKSVTVTVSNTTPTIEMAENMMATVNQVTQFTGKLIDPDSCDSHTYQWNFGDGGTADTLNASHTYMKRGEEYTATLIVTDKFGGVSTNSLKVKVVGSAPVVELGDNIVLTVGELFTFNGAISDADGNAPYQYEWLFGDETETPMGSIASNMGTTPVTQSIQHAFTDSGRFTVTLNVNDNDGTGSDSMIVTVRGLNAEPCNEPTVVSTQSGNWHDPIWKVTNEQNAQPRRLELGDFIKIQAGHTITAPNSRIELGIGTLCNEGTLQSRDNLFGQSATRVEIHAEAVHNKGIIKGKDGVHGNCGQQAGAGSRILIMAKEVKNEVAPTGLIQAGNGGNAPQGAKHPCPAQRCGEGQDTYAGQGGSVEIYSGTTYNTGKIISGDGGNAGAAHAQALGGNGGALRITTNTDDESPSLSTGMLVSGKGGNICAPIAGWQRCCYGGRLSSPGRGGDMHLFLEVLGGTVVGQNGSTLYYDPINLRADSSLNIAGFDAVEIYTDEGGTIDFRQLTEGAISATKTIKISTQSLNGKGGSIDLRGVSSKVFNAGEKVEIFADEPMMDNGTTLEALASAPEVTVSEGKIIYSVAISGESQFIGEAGATLTIPLKVTNSGPKRDTYTFSISDSAGWQIGSLTSSTVDGLETRDISLSVTLATTPGAEDVITLTANSQAEPSTTASLTVKVGVNPGEDSDGDGYPDSRDAFPSDATEWLDSDSDGIGNNVDTDDDNDGMPDTWEKQFEGLSCVIDDASQDADGDGYSNMEENQIGTNPDVPNTDSTPKDEDESKPTPVITDEDESKPTPVITDEDESKPTPVIGDYSASGTLLNELGEPIVGATIQVADKQTLTNAAGNWTITGLPEGTHQATMTLAGYAPISTNFAVGNDQNATLKFKPTSLLKVKVSAKPWRVEQGDNLTYLMTVTNEGAETATNVVLTDVLPQTATLVSMEADGGNCDASTLTCSLPDLAAGEQTTVTMVVNNTESKTLLNTATVKADEYPVDVQKSWTRVIRYLSVSISDNREPLPIAEMLTYTLDVVLSDKAPSNATGVELVMTLPNNFEVKSVDTDEGNCDLSNWPKAVCSLSDLSIDSKATLEITVILKDAGQLLLRHQASVTANEYPTHKDEERTTISVSGVEVDMVFIVDDSGSMQAEINGVKKALIEFIDAIDTSESPLIALITFKDDVKVRAFTRNLEVLLAAVNALKASGGGACEEASVEAINIGISHTKEGGFILFVTDASPYDDADVEGTIERLRSKGLVFNPMITGDCSLESSWNDLPNDD